MSRLTRLRVLGNWYLVASGRLRRAPTPPMEGLSSGEADHALIMLTFSIILELEVYSLPIKVPT